MNMEKEIEKIVDEFWKQDVKSCRNHTSFTKARAKRIVVKSMKATIEIIEDLWEGNIELFLEKFDELKEKLK